MCEFEYREEDLDGQATLETIAEAEKFNKWMYQTIIPFCSGKILEIGSGIGNISKFFIESEVSITLSDIRSSYCNLLKHKFNHAKSVEDVLLIDLSDQDFELKFNQLKNTFDTVFALNVVEHIKDDNFALKNCRFLLKSGGTLIVLVPAYHNLYNKFDKSLGHYRRYTKSTIKDIFVSNAFEIIHSQYFNIMGIFGWFISGTILGKESIPKKQMMLYNALVPVFKIIDKLFSHSFGLSVIVIGRK